MAQGAGVQGTGAGLRVGEVGDNAAGRPFAIAGGCQGIGCDESVCEVHEKRHVVAAGVPVFIAADADRLEAREPGFRDEAIVDVKGLIRPAQPVQGGGLRRGGGPGGKGVPGAHEPEFPLQAMLEGRVAQCAVAQIPAGMTVEIAHDHGRGGVEEVAIEVEAIENRSHIGGPLLGPHGEEVKGLRSHHR